MACVSGKRLVGTGRTGWNTWKARGNVLWSKKKIGGGEGKGKMDKSRKTLCGESTVGGAEGQTGLRRELALSGREMWGERKGWRKRWLWLKWERQFPKPCEEGKAQGEALVLGVWGFRA